MLSAGQRGRRGGLTTPFFLLARSRTKPLENHNRATPPHSHTHTASGMFALVNLPEKHPAATFHERGVIASACARVRARAHTYVHVCVRVCVSCCAEETCWRRADLGQSRESSAEILWPEQCVNNNRDSVYLLWFKGPERV